MYKTLILGLTTIFACMSSGQAYEVDLAKENLLTFAFDRFDPPIAGQPEMDDERRNILKRFGYPEQIETIIEPDRGEPGYDVEIAHWKYDGLTINMITSLLSMHTRAKITSITINSTKHELQFGLNIGSSKIDYQRYLGRPNKVETNTYIYQTGRYTNVEGIDFYASQDVIIEFDDQGRSTSITWTYAGH